MVEVPGEAPLYPTHCSLCGEPLDEHTDLACREAWRRERNGLRAENDRLRTALEKIADSGNVHSSWLVGDAREALGLPRNTW